MLERCAAAGLGGQHRGVGVEAGVAAEGARGESGADHQGHVGAEVLAQHGDDRQDDHEHPPVGAGGEGDEAHHGEDDERQHLGADQRLDGGDDVVGESQRGIDLIEQEGRDQHRQGIDHRLEALQNVVEGLAGREFLQGDERHDHARQGDEDAHQEVEIEPPGEKGQ